MFHEEAIWINDVLAHLNLCKDSVILDIGCGKGFLETFSPGGIKHIGAYFLKNNYHIPKGLDSGWIIPQQLKKRWQLYKGLSMEILPDKLEQISPVNIFCMIATIQRKI